MNKKLKYCLTVLVLLLAFALVGCKTNKVNNNDEVKKFVLNNLVDAAFMNENKALYNDMVKIDLPKENYKKNKGLYAYNNQEAGSEVEGKACTWTVFSLFENKEIFKKENCKNIYFYDNDLMPAYFVAVFSKLDANKNEIAEIVELYDYQGNPINNFEFNEYSDLDVVVEKIDNVLYEVFSVSGTRTVKGKEELVIDVVTYRSMGQLSSRVTVNEGKPIVKPTEDPDKGNILPIRGNLKELGLQDYLVNTVDSFITIYDKEMNVVNTFSLELFNDFDFYEIINGVVLLQRSIELPEDATEYDYYTESSSTITKYDLITKKYDMINDTMENIDTDYIFDSLKPCKDSSENYTIAVVEAEKIENKVTNDLKKYVIDNNANVKFGLYDGIDYLNISKVGIDHFFDNTNYIYLDENLNPIMDFSVNGFYHISGTDAFDINNELIILRRGIYYGIVDFDLNIIVPFEYDKINLNAKDTIVGVKDNKVQFMDYTGKVITSKTGDTFNNYTFIVELTDGYEINEYVQYKSLKACTKGTLDRHVGIVEGTYYEWYEYTDSITNLPAIIRVSINFTK